MGVAGEKLVAALFLDATVPQPYSNGSGRSAEPGKRMYLVLYTETILGIDSELHSWRASSRDGTQGDDEVFTSIK